MGYQDTTLRGSSTAQMGNNLPAINVGAGRTVTAVATGYKHTCVILDNGTLKCFGKNTNGELGYAGK